MEEQDNEDAQLHELYEELLNSPAEIVPVHGGSVPGRKFLERNHQARHIQLMNDYFIERPLYLGEILRRRFRMKRPFFLRILADCERENIYFRQRYDVSHQARFSPILKVTIAMRTLAYAGSYDSNDENFRVAESTICEIVREFCQTILRLYKDQYLRAPTQADLAMLLNKSERRGFPGMIGSLDCIHWTWKNCPTAWQGSFSGHAFFGVPGALNDITVLGRSPLFNNLTSGNLPEVQYEVNGHTYYMPYYLADGIYPKWGTLIQSVRSPRTNPEQVFSRFQESFRKDVERAFGILQARFAFVNQPGRGWHTRDLSNIMLTCIIHHTMIVEDERDEYKDDDSDDDDNDISTSRRARARIYPCRGGQFRDVERKKQMLDKYMLRYEAIRSKETNPRLQKDLIAHVYAKYG